MCDHRTGEKFVTNAEHRWVCSDKGTISKVSARQVHRTKRAAAKRPLQTDMNVYHATLDGLMDGAVDGW